jgi:aspartate/methionine/tyrosine aminotransferase
MGDRFVKFELERWMSTWENIVKFNLSESGVHPMTVTELVDDPQMIEDLLSTGLNYPQTNGVPELRERIAALYPNATPANVLVTTGAAQANFTSLWTLLEPNDKIAVMLPNYMQIWGLAQNFQLDLKTFTLAEKMKWALDLDALSEAVTGDTKLIAICNPNNPTGYILTEDEMDAVVSIADRVGAWVLADEVYAGAERLTDEKTPTFWGRYDRVLAVGSMSKAYGLPGLRLGWVVAPVETVEDLWARQDYITIGNTMLANKLGLYALDPAVLPRIIERTRDYIRKGYANFEIWAQDHLDLFSWVPPQAAAIVFVRYAREANSSKLCKRLIKEEDAYVVPGDHFGMDGYLRISFGLPKDYLLEGLKRVQRVVASAS